MQREIATLESEALRDIAPGRHQNKSITITLL